MRLRLVFVGASVSPLLHLDVTEIFTLMATSSSRTQGLDLNEMNSTSTLCAGFEVLVSGGSHLRRGPRSLPLCAPSDTCSSCACAGLHQPSVVLSKTGSTTQGDAPTPRAPPFAAPTPPPATSSLVFQAQIQSSSSSSRLTGQARGPAELAGWLGKLSTKRGLDHVGSGSRFVKPKFPPPTGRPLPSRPHVT